jgi:hypothetical protein
MVVGVNLVFAGLRLVYWGTGVKAVQRSAVPFEKSKLSRNQTNKHKTIIF